MLILKDKNQMTNKELKDLEAIIFPIIVEHGEDNEALKKAFVSLIKDKGEEVSKLVYKDIQEEPFLFQLMQDFPNVLSYVFEASEQGKPQATKPQRIAKR